MINKNNENSLSNIRKNQIWKLTIIEICLYSFFTFLITLIIYLYSFEFKTLKTLIDVASFNINLFIIYFLLYFCYYIILTPSFKNYDKLNFLKLSSENEQRIIDKWENFKNNNFLIFLIIFVRLIFIAIIHITISIELLFILSGKPLKIILLLFIIILTISVFLPLFSVKYKEFLLLSELSLFSNTVKKVFEKKHSTNIRDELFNLINLKMSKLYNKKRHIDAILWGLVYVSILSIIYRFLFDN